MKTRAIHIFDFDGTLFRTPEKPEWWPSRGWWGRIESLSPPVIPYRPNKSWWNPRVVRAARKSYNESGVYSALITGRSEGCPGMKVRVKELLTDKGVPFTREFFNPGGPVLEFKQGLLENLLLVLPGVEEVRIWDDSPEYSGELARVALPHGVECTEYEIPRVSHEVGCSHEEYLRNSWGIPTRKLP